jgi:hypothetical protein
MMCAVENTASVIELARVELSEILIDQYLSEAYEYESAPGLGTRVRCRLPAERCIRRRRARRNTVLASKPNASEPAGSRRRKAASATYSEQPAFADEPAIP